MRFFMLVAGVALLCAFPSTAQQIRNPLETNRQEWLERIMRMGGAPSAPQEPTLPGMELDEAYAGPKAWDGYPQIVEEEVYDPPAPYFETAQFFRILTPIAFTATKGEDYQKPAGSGNAAPDYWRLFSGLPTRGGFDLFVEATNKRNCDFAAANLLSDPFGYERNNVQFLLVWLFLGTQLEQMGERVRQSGPRVKLDFYHRVLTLADHVDSQQLNMHWAWMAYRFRRVGCAGLVDYYQQRGDRVMARKYERYSAQALTYYNTLRRRYYDLARAFVEGDVDQFRAYVLDGPNREIQKELLLLSAIMLRVAEDLSTAEEIQEMGKMPGWQSLKVLRFTKIRPRHYEGIYGTLKALAEDEDRDASLRAAAEWALTAEQDSMVSKLTDRNRAFQAQIANDPMETGL